MMKLGPILGKMVAGESVIREFSTVGLDDNVSNIREKVFLQAGERVLEISDRQWLLGLDPRILGVWVTEKEELSLLEQTATYKMFFMDATIRQADPVTLHRNAIAVINLSLFQILQEDNGSLFLLKAMDSDIRHIHSLKARLLYWKFYRKPDVSFDRLKAVAAAYTYPRRVRVISFKQDADYNYIFPMDLLGDIRSSGRYLLGMRHSNQVLTKIMDEKKIVVSEVPAEYKPLIYKLGRNHSASPPPLDQLPFGVIPSREFGFYIPEWVESYKEVHIRKTLNLGSHMLLFGQWSTDNVLKEPTPRLHHIHFLHFLYQKYKGSGYPVV